MKERTERVRRLKEDFVAIRKNHPEKTTREIAEEYGVSTRHMYQVIDELSKEMGISKEELLIRPHKKHSMRQTGQQHAEKANPKELMEQIDEALECVGNIIQELDELERKNANVMKKMEENV